MSPSRFLLKVVLASSLCFPALAGTYKEIYRFRGTPDGAKPINKLTEVNGALYGVTYAGGARDRQRGGWGTIFKVDPSSGAEPVAYTFHLPGEHKEALPYQTLLSANGLLYGAIECDHGCPVSADFAFDPSSGSITKSQIFGNGNNDGAGGMVVWRDRIWGADFGGANGSGSIFTLSKSGKRTLAYSFPPLDEVGQPHFPESTPVPLGDLLYGSANLGGEYNNGTIFAYNPASGVLKVLYAFTGNKDVGGPTGDLTLVGQTLYGTNETCNSGCSGTLFAFDTQTGKLKTVHAFSGGRDGGFPSNGVTK